jgi:DNA-binding transcriptional ArsR family regulator
VQQPADRPSTEIDRVLREPTRRRIVEAMAADAEHSWTVRRLAEALGREPTRLYHHVRLLVAAGLIEIAERRLVNGIGEAHYRLTPVAAPTSPADPPGLEAAVPTPPEPADRRHVRHVEEARNLRKSRTSELIAISLAIVVGMYSFGVISFSAGPSISDLGALDAAGEVEGPFGPAEPDDLWWELQRAGGPGKVLDQAAVVRAQNQARALRQATANENAALPASAPRQLRGAWEHVGPNNVGGRIADLVIDVDDPNVIYAATASGGLWKGVAHADDDGITMEYAWDNSLPQGMGSIAMGSDGRLWAGTGEHNPGGGSTTFPGDGVYVSSDRGQTWRNVGLRNSSTTGEIAVRPDDPNTIFVAASGSLFNPGGERGIYRSDTGGANWKLVLAPETPFTGGIDLAIDPSNPDRVFAAMWDHRREPHIRKYGGVGSGLFRSDDGGETWTRLENVTTLASGDPTGLASDPDLGRIGVAIAPSNPDRVYVITGRTNGGDKGFYVSNDGGASFAAAGYPGSQGGFQWWFGRLTVDPFNQDHLFAMGVNLRRSTNGGVSWGNSGGIHVDQHTLEFSTAIPDRVYLGNDGGIYRSDNNGASGGWEDATNQPYMQIYMFDVGEQAPDRLVAGFQDQGSWRSWTGTNPGNPDAWSSYNGGDGLHTLINPDYNDLYFGCSQYGSCVRRVNGTAPVGNATISSGSNPAGRRNWNTPLVIDPSDSSVMYIGTSGLYRSTAYGSGWTALSAGVDLTGDWTTHGGELDPVYGSRWGTLTAIGVSKSAPDTIYVGADTGRLWKTEDLGANWTEFTDAGLPQRWVTRVAVDPLDSQTVYATFSGYRAGEVAAHVFKTTDGGATWTDISGNLPNGPVNDVVIDHANSTVYIGSDTGVYYLKNGKKNWKPAGIDLPLAPVLDIRLHEGSNQLFASTFGRGAFALDLSQ